jgi:hypothetical protein
VHHSSQDIASDMQGLQLRMQYAEVEPNQVATAAMVRRRA